MEQAPPTTKLIESFMKEFVMKKNDVPFGFDENSTANRPYNLWYGTLNNLNYFN